MRIKKQEVLGRWLGLAVLCLTCAALPAQISRAADPDPVVPAIRETTAAPPVTMKFDGSRVPIMERRDTPSDKT